MDKFMGQLISQHTPQMNRATAEGLAVTHLAGAQAYLDQIFRSAAKGFPAGLLYTGCRRCDPREEFAIATVKKGSKRQFDIARSDVFMMKYGFTFNGEELPSPYMYLPFVGEAGYMTIGGGRFNISPVLSDRVISVGTSSVFTRLLRDRLTFKRMPQHVMFDDRIETVQVTWSQIYHKNERMKKVRPTVKAESTLVHYLFCKYGFTDAFKLFGKTTPVIGGKEIHESSYPSDQWVICTSAANLHAGYRRTMIMQSNIRIAIRRDEMSPMVKSMVAAFFYVATLFPVYVTPEYVNSKRMWMTVMGHVIFSGHIHDGKLHDDIADHMRSLDEYLDSLVVEKLADIEVHVDNVYELFALVNEKFNEWIIGANDKVASMYDKEISILYYVLYEITASIFNLCYRLKAAAKKEIGAKEIINIMNQNLKPGRIFGLTKNHGEISNISTPGDNKAFKVTALLVPQSSSDRRTRKKELGSIGAPEKRLHVSVAEVGGYSNLPKSAPDGRSRLNPHVKLNSKDVVMRDPELMPMLDEIQEMIKR